MNTKKVAYLGLLIALAFVLSYVEVLLPLNIGIPGAKVGLANIVVVVALYTIGGKNAGMLSLVRVLLVGLTFGNFAMMLYSLAGAILSSQLIYYLPFLIIIGTISGVVIGILSGMICKRVKVAFS